MMISRYLAVSKDVLSRAESFWQQDFSQDTHDLLRFSFFMGFFPFAGYFFHYTVTGQVWNSWPFINSTLPVLRGLMCAGLQWVFFSTFATISTLIIESVSARSSNRPDPLKITAICTYSMVPMHLSTLFVGALFVDRTAILCGFATFLYLLYFGYRQYAKLTVWRSVLMTALVSFLFALIRQMFVFVIGF